MHAPGDRPRDPGTDAPWSATAGGALLAVAVLSALWLQGTTYPCRGPPACLRVVHFPSIQRALLLGSAAAGLAFAVGIRFVPWSRRLVAASAVLAVPAVALALHWWLTYVGRLDGGASLVPLVAGVGATGLLAHAAARTLTESDGRTLA